MIFDFAIDKLVIHTVRDKFEVEAESVEEATELMKKFFETGEQPDEVAFTESEDVYDDNNQGLPIEITPEQNQGQATQWLYYRAQNGYSDIKDNAKGQD